MWEMVIYLGISWAGYGSVNIIRYADMDQCFKALEKIKCNDGKQCVAVCKPVNPTKKGK